MNRIEKLNEKQWTLICEDGSTYLCNLWEEKKTDKNGQPKSNFHVKLPKENPSGRQYINVNKLNPDGSYEFATDTSVRTGMGWRSKLTPEEEEEVKKAEETIERIKKVAMSRKEDEVSKLEREIAKKIAELEALKAKRE